MKNHSSVALIGTILAAALLPQPAAAQSYSAQANYPNPSQQETQAARSMTCRDPWVSLALQKVAGSVDPAYCLVKLYNNGNWDSFNTLVHAVARTRSQLSQQGAQLAAARFPNGGPGVVLKLNGQIVAAGGGNLIGQDGASLIGKGGAGVVSVPANLIGTGVGSLQLGGAGERHLQSKGSVRLPSGALYY